MPYCPRLHSTFLHRVRGRKVIHLVSSFSELVLHRNFPYKYSLLSEENEINPSLRLCHRSTYCRYCLSLPWKKLFYLQCLEVGCKPSAGRCPGGASSSRPSSNQFIWLTFILCHVTQLHVMPCFCFFYMGLRLKNARRIVDRRKCAARVTGKESGAITRAGTWTGDPPGAKALLIGLLCWQSCPSSGVMQQVM